MFSVIFSSLSWQSALDMLSLNNRSEGYNILVRAGKLLINIMGQQGSGTGGRPIGTIGSNAIELVQI